MHQQTRDNVDWEQPFPHGEYGSRHRKLRDALAASGYSGILVTSPADLNYLFGYDQVWFSHDTLCSCFLSADDDDYLFFDNDGHELLISTYPEIGNVCYFARGKVTDQFRVICDEIVDRGWARGTIALQPRCYGAHPDHVRAMGGILETAGAKLADGSDLVEDVRLIKSALEIDIMRRAAEIATRAMTKARESIQAGMRETELEGIIVGEMMRSGGGYPGIRSMIGGGPRAGLHHEPASHRTFERGEIVHVDFCASLHRYHANICRSFALGDVDQRWVDLFDRNAPMMDHIVREVRPGDSMAKMHEVSAAFAEEHDLARYDWLIGGYTLGIAIPPDWVGRHRPAPREDIAPPPLHPGLVMNFENQYDTYKENWSGAPGAGLIDTLLMTDDGFEILTPLSRRLEQVG